MSFEALQERLAQLEETKAQLKSLIAWLANLSFETESGPASEDDAADLRDPQKDDARTQLIDSCIQLSRVR